MLVKGISENLLGKHISHMLLEKCISDLFGLDKDMNNIDAPGKEPQRPPRHGEGLQQNYDNDSLKAVPSPWCSTQEIGPDRRHCVHAKDCPGVQRQNWAVTPTMCSLAGPTTLCLTPDAGYPEDIVDNARNDFESGSHRLCLTSRPSRVPWDGPSPTAVPADEERATRAAASEHGLGEP